MPTEHAENTEAVRDSDPFERRWAPARTIPLDEATPGGPRSLLYARFEHAGTLALSYDEVRPALLLNAPDCNVGDLVEIVVALDSGPVRLWCGRGAVVARRVRRQRSGDDVEVVPLAEDRDAWLRLEDISLGVATVRHDRSAERVPARLKATVRVAAEPERKVTTRDLAPGGAGFEDEGIIDLGVPVEVDLKTSLFGPSIVVRGVVCWTAPHHGFGVRFLFDRSRQRQEVEALLARHR